MRRARSSDSEEKRSKLGHIRSVSVKEVMTKEVITVSPKTTVRELKDLFEKHDFNAFPVVENGILVGIVTKLDLMSVFSVGLRFSMTKYWNLFANEVRRIMREAVVSVEPNDSIQRAVEYMVEFGLRSLPVVEGKRLVGIVSREDLMEHLLFEEEP